jgi:hypothetical protein
MQQVGRSSTLPPNKLVFGESSDILNTPREFRHGTHRAQERTTHRSFEVHEPWQLDTIVKSVGYGLRVDFTQRRFR